jgi:sarcosine oxidase subunit alpha
MNDHGAGRIGNIERRAISFTWNGTPMTGAEGDTVASALIANGERVFTIHPTSGQPRGGFCLVGRCSDCLVVVDGQPGTIACVTFLVDGLRVERQVGHGHWGEEGS